MATPLRIWSVPDSLVCVPGDLPESVLSALRSVVRGRAPLDVVLDTLAADGLSSAPPFLCAERVPAGVRVVVRGGLEAVAHGADGSTAALGAGRAVTWHDDVVADIVAISLDQGDGAVLEWMPALQSGTAPSEPGPSTPPPPPEPDPEPPAEPEPVGDVPSGTPPVGSTPDFSGLLDQTRHGEVTPAPLPPPPPSPLPPPPPPAATATAPSAPPDDTTLGSGLGERDGATVTIAELRDRHGDLSSGDQPSAPAAPTPPGPGQVHAVHCPQGHANAPTVSACRICGGTIADPAVTVIDRPVLALLTFESGAVVEVDRPQLIGRGPTVDPAGPHDDAHLVTIPSPDGDISRNHTAVRVEGWDLLVEDLGSTNGTEVRLPGRDPVRLREYQPVLLLAGTEVTMAGIVRFRLDAPPA